MYSCNSEPPDACLPATRLFRSYAQDSTRLGMKDARQEYANTRLLMMRQIAIVAVPPARMHDVVGPSEVFAEANKMHEGEPAYAVEIIAAAEDRAVSSQIGMPILAHRTYRELHRRVDALLVAGGKWPPDKQHAPDYLYWLQDQSSRVRRLGSICTGALVLADADLLNGRIATTTGSSAMNL